MENSRRKPDQTIDIIFLIRAVLKNWWVILLTACIVSMWAYMGTSFVKTPKYSSDATLIISSKRRSNEAYGEAAIEKVANQFQRIFTSDALKNTITKKLGKNTLPGTLNAQVESGTNLLIITGTSTNPMDAYRIVSAAMNNYMLVSDYVVSDFILEVMKNPQVPVQSNNYMVPKKAAMTGFAGGLAVMTMLILLIFFMKDDIKNEKQISTALDIPLFATVYFEEKRDNLLQKLRKKKESILITDPNTSFSYKETMSKLATKLDYQAKKEGAKVVLVTSVSENEGKSTIASNLALELAKKQKNVVLFDTDLRRPAMYKIFETSVKKEQELLNYLIPKKDSENGQKKVKDWTKEEMLRDPNTGLYCLFGTKKCARSDSIIRSRQMDRLLREMKKSMDYIILDSTPGIVASDAELLAEKADFILMIVRQGVSNVGEINDMVDNLSGPNRKVLGCIFNAVKLNLIPWNGTYGYSNYYYSRYYDSYYQTNKKQGKKVGDTDDASIR